MPRGDMVQVETREGVERSGQQREGGTHVEGAGEEKTEERGEEVVQQDVEREGGHLRHGEPEQGHGVEGLRLGVGIERPASEGVGAP